MLDINKFKNNSFFKSLELKSGDILFDEGDLDNNIYIVESGTLSVEKYTTKDKKALKTLGVINKGGILGEASISNSDSKEVRISAKEDTKLIYIDAKEGLNDYISSNSSDGIELLGEIINISNKRLLESNSLVTSAFEMSKSISEIEQHDNKNLFELIDKFRDIIGCEYIIYLEKNSVLGEYINIKYDTRNKGRMLSNFINISDELSLQDISNEGIELLKNNLIQELKNKNINLGYLVIGTKDELSESEKKVVCSISSLFAGAIKQKELFEEEKNKEYINS